MPADLFADRGGTWTAKPEKNLSKGNLIPKPRIEVLPREKGALGPSVLRLSRQGADLYFFNVIIRDLPQTTRASGRILAIAIALFGVAAVVNACANAMRSLPPTTGTPARTQLKLSVGTHYGKCLKGDSAKKDVKVDVLRQTTSHPLTFVIHSTDSSRSYPYDVGATDGSKLNLFARTTAPERSLRAVISISPSSKDIEIRATEKSWECQRMVVYDVVERL